jgi:hypothetical protein
MSAWRAPHPERQFDLESALLTTMQRLPDAGASGN